MRSIIIAFILAVGSFVFINGCQNSDTETGETLPQSSGTTVVNGSGEADQTINLDLPTVQCSMCKKTIEKAFKDVDGVENINVSVKEKNAVMNYDPSKISNANIEEIIVLAGYDVNGKPADKSAYNELHDCCKKPEDREDKNSTH